MEKKKRFGVVNQLVRIAVWERSSGELRYKRETAGDEEHPLQDHLSDLSRNQGGRRPGGVCAGGLGSARTSAINLSRE